MNVNLKSLVGKLNETCRGALEAGAGLCLSRTNYDVEIEHFLFKLVEAADTDVARIFRHFEVDASRLSADLTRALDRLKTGNSRTPALSPRLVDLLEAAWMAASLDTGGDRVRSGHVLLALVSDDGLARIARDVSRELERVSAETLRSNFAAVTQKSGEAKDAGPAAAAAPAQSGGDDAPVAATNSKTPALDQYTIDLTARARAGKIDPVLGRDTEIRQIVDILTRRRQNNPILTGEAGVGKTAVVEGFALRVAEGDVPPSLKDIAVRTLDLGLLQAGAGIKGEFENRLKTVIDEVKASPRPIVLFVDEAHTMIGAGASAGQSDAANLLKPALARGELRTIAATTWAEYKKYFEKDAALARRFQVVKVEEPTEEQAVVMIRSLVPLLEKHFDIRVLSDAVDAAVRLSHRYIAGRQLPDKAVSVMDTACARVALGQTAVPASVEGARRRIDELKAESGSLEREAATGTDHARRLDEIREALAAEETRLADLVARWERERDLTTKIRETRAALEAVASGAAAAPAPVAVGTAVGEARTTSEPSAPPSPDELRADLNRMRDELATLQGETPLVEPWVTSQTIAEVVSGWTGIPVGKMMVDEINSVLELESRLGRRVIGQDHGLAAIARRIRTSRANLTDPRRPVGVFLLVGPSGVGKTETALALAEALYGGERNLITINMSEYQEAHTVSGLKGSPPGYVGYGEGGVLTEAVRRRPYSVVLLDEAEKAHTDVAELFYQVFDKGVLEDGEGREIDFKNTVILLTTNTATDAIMKLTADPDTAPEPEALVEAIRPELLKTFKAALLGRMSVVPYYPITDPVMRDIVRLQLGRVADRVKANHGADFTYDESVVEAIAARCREVESGARTVDHILTRTLLPEMSGEFLSRLAQGKDVTSVRVSVADGDFAYDIR